jgi:hypothetical protein
MFMMLVYTIAYKFAMHKCYLAVFIRWRMIRVHG